MWKIARDEAIVRGEAQVIINALNARVDAKWAALRSAVAAWYQATN
jgi:hypothetical protein